MNYIIKCLADSEEKFVKISENVISLVEEITESTLLEQDKVCYIGSELNTVYSIQKHIRISNFQFIPETILNFN